MSRLVRRYRRYRKNRRENGQALVEFALTIPLILILLIGLAAVAYVLFSWITLYHAANEGLSYTLRNPISGNTQSEREQEVVTAVEESVTPNLYSLFAEGTVACSEDKVTGYDWYCTYSETPATTVNISIPSDQVAVTVRYEVPLPRVSIPLIVSDDVFTVMAPFHVRATGAGYYD